MAFVLAKIEGLERSPLNDAVRTPEQATNEKAKEKQKTQTDTQTNAKQTNETNKNKQTNKHTTEQLTTQTVPIPCPKDSTHNTKQ